MMNPKAAEAFVECFNENHPPGTLVVVIGDYGERTHTVVESKAYVMSGKQPVIFLKDINGCYDLTRVVVLNREK